MPSTPKRGFRAKLVVISTVLLAGAGALASQRGVPLAAAHTSAPEGGRPAASADAPRPVRTAAPARGPLAHPIRATGATRAFKQLDLAFLVGGEVTWVGVDVGSRVTRGQVLARIDTTPFAAAAERARATSEKASRDLDRARALERSGSIASASLDDATTGESIAAAAAREADFALRHGVIVAPDDGVVDARMVDPGEVVSVGTPAFRMSGHAQGVVVRVDLSGRDVLGLAVGRPARVRLDASPGAPPLLAHVSQVASTASSEAGTFQVDVHLDDEAAEAWPTGLTAKVEIDRTASPGCAVPLASLVPGDGNADAVVAVDGDRARKLPVHVLFLEGAQAALAEPLDGVGAVATEGALSLVDGAVVTRIP